MEESPRWLTEEKLAQIAADTLKLLEGRTARFCNQALGRTGKFWHHEIYDHVIRDEREYERVVWYVLNNPVKAGLVEHWED